MVTEKQVQRCVFLLVYVVLDSEGLPPDPPPTLCYCNWSLSW